MGQQENNKVPNLQGEVWKDCVGYEGKYKVSNLGRVKSCPYTYIYPSNGKKKYIKEKLKKFCETGRLHNNTQTRYYCTRLTNKDGIDKAEYIHRLVAKAFIPNPNNLPTVNHIDGNKHNNNVSNLEWASYSENNQHAYNGNLKSDNKPLFRTDENGVIKQIYISESNASLLTGIDCSRIRASSNKHISDCNGDYWTIFEPDKYMIKETDKKE